MKSVYIEARALFRAYKEEPGSDVMDYLFGSMESKAVMGHTSQLSIPEILIHADSHFSVAIVKDKMETIDIREKEASNNLKILVE